MRRWFTLCGAFVVAVALLLVSGDAPTHVRGQTPPPTPAAGGAAPPVGPPVAASPALENVRQELMTFFAGMKDVADQARQSPNARTRAALATGPNASDAAFAQVQQALANATPDQLTAFQNVLTGVPNLPNLPAELRSALNNTAASSAAPKDGTNLPINTNGSTYSTFEDTTNGTLPLASETCESHFSGLLVDPNAQHRFDARAVWIGSWVTQQVISALQVAYNVASSVSAQVIDILGLGGIEFNPVAAALGVAIGIANAISLGELEELQEILDCVTNSYAENLYTEDLAAKMYQELALEADVTKGRAAAIAAGLSTGACTPVEELPASVTIGTGSETGELEDVKWFVTNLLTQMQLANMATGNAGNLVTTGEQYYSQGLWKQSCQAYAQAFVVMSQAGASTSGVVLGRGVRTP